MKALEILKKPHHTSKFNNVTMVVYKKDQIDEAIAELEALQQPKSCDGCKQSWKPNNQTFHKYFCEYLQIPVHGDFCCNKHEPKDNA